MNYTFENILEKVINNQFLSRKEKQVALSAFIKANSGDNKPKTEKEVELLASFKAIKQSYSQLDAKEKQRDAVAKAAY